VIAQVDEQHAAVVAHAVHPAGEPDFLVDVALAERAAGVGAVAMHHVESSWVRGMPAARTRAGPESGAQPHSVPPRVKAWARNAV
jgi:hypothetical protein